MKRKAEKLKKRTRTEAKCMKNNYLDIKGYLYNSSFSKVQP